MNAQASILPSESMPEHTGARHVQLRRLSTERTTLFAFAQWQRVRERAADVHCSIQP